MTPRTRNILLVVFVGVLPLTYTAIVFTGLVTGMFDDGKLLSGPVPDVWSVPTFDPAPVVLPGATWASLPARGPDGTLVGLVHDTSRQASVVKLDEATGRTVWQLALGPLPDGLVRTDGWRVGEHAPKVPLVATGAGLHALAGDRWWALVSTAGALVATGNFPDDVPPVSAIGGLCPVDTGFWIALEDNRDGGIALSQTGVLATVRSDRPASCPHVGDGGDAAAISPMQNARATLKPADDDDTSQGYPTEVCGKYNKSSRRNRGREYCTDLRTDGPAEQSVMLRIGDPVFRDGDDWQHIRRPTQYDGGIDFHPSILGYDLAFPRAFFDMVQYRNITVQNNPSATSFEPKRSEQQTEVVELIASIARTGELQWVHTMQRAPLPALSSTFYDNVKQSRSLLLASDPASPTQNLYIFKPGLLLAVDQTTGAPRFQIGAPLPPPTNPTAPPAAP